MKHPKIPPKSERFHFHDWDKPGYWAFEPMGWTLDDPDPLPCERPIIAAVAEVEWRKRSERWAEVSRRVFVRQMMRRNGTTSHHRKTLAYQSERAARHVLIADENAAAWREWGEEKAT